MRSGCRPSRLPQAHAGTVARRIQDTSSTGRRGSRDCSPPPPGSWADDGDETNPSSSTSRHLVDRNSRHYTTPRQEARRHPRGDCSTARLEQEAGAGRIYANTGDTVGPSQGSKKGSDTAPRGWRWGDSNPRPEDSSRNILQAYLAFHVLVLQVPTSGDTSDQPD